MMRKSMMVLAAGAAVVGSLLPASVSATLSAQVDYSQTEIVNHHSAALVSFQIELSNGELSNNMLRSNVRADGGKQRLGLVKEQEADGTCNSKAYAVFADDSELWETINFCEARWINVSGEAIWGEAGSN